MPVERLVSLFMIDGPESGYVVVRHQTGITYLNQYGGTACRWGRVEGYLVPVDLTEARSTLDALFLTERNGAGLGSPRAQDESTLRVVRRAVEAISFWPSIDDLPGPGEFTTYPRDFNLKTSPGPLRLDESRIQEADEAWIPVISPDGPAVLVWPNSD